MKFETHGVLSAVTGSLLGDFAALNKVADYLLQRPVFFHELPLYAERMQTALLVCHPELPDDANSDNWEEVRDTFVAKWGDTMELDPALKGVLADDKDPVETLKEMGFGGKIITPDGKLH
ncbi:hypothetical protein [Sulfitobacter sp. R18_1]|uniref:DUF7736 domain-containing protein n=1 Tax=Sulfitobacter sp. R18_1 TaxID=2821104 RepID=UPI001ADA4382|nr:hypothetical protein [Sulfitobacter sp. R18_1]MBO9428283.1 hypothetical protein [Sulfitobacter sp. R18_1]